MSFNPLDVSIIGPENSDGFLAELTKGRRVILSQDGRTFSVIQPVGELTLFDRVRDTALRLASYFQPSYWRNTFRVLKLAQQQPLNVRPLHQLDHKLFGVHHMTALVLAYLDPEDLAHAMRVCKAWYRDAQPTMLKHAAQLQCSQELLSIFPAAQVSHLPALRESGARAAGTELINGQLYYYVRPNNSDAHDTRLIDWIDPEMMEKPIMRVQDPYGRLCIALRLSYCQGEVEGRTVLVIQATRPEKGAPWSSAQCGVGLDHKPWFVQRLFHFGINYPYLKRLVAKESCGLCESVINNDGTVTFKEFPISETSYIKLDI